jgi:HAD superfamily hydrolase (TIGR01509 family)
MAVKAIIFDCFGVLVIPGRTLWYQNYPQLINQIDDIEHQSDYGMISQKEFYESMADLTGVDSKTLKIKYHDNKVRNESMIDLVRKLRLSGKYKIGMLTNAGHGWINEFFSPYEKMDLFDEIILSGNVGIAKPELAIFGLIINRLGIDSSECVMIDDMSINIEGAKNAGMQGLVYVSNSQTRLDLSKLIKFDHA